ncbi:hypothetical protein B6N31_09500 [Dickeya fangzhongdai]|nr:hypothetical protein B6N31_09500 [Dickeya fangzhongdai]
MCWSLSLTPVSYPCRRPGSRWVAACARLELFRVNSSMHPCAIAFAALRMRHYSNQTHTIWIS